MMGFSARLVVVVAVVASSPVFAQDAVKPLQTAETMMELCEGSRQNEDPSLQSLICTFRIQGVADIMSMNCLSAGNDWNPSPVLSASPIKSNKAIRQTFLNYMKEHPESWREYWAVVLAIAISEKFPCEPA